VRAVEDALARLQAQAPDAAATLGPLIERFDYQQAAALLVGQ
jgi:hypothetical protein